MQQGRCLCGGIRFQIADELAPIQLCHCGQCRQAQGGAFASNIPVAEGAFQLLAGAELLQPYESSPGKQRVFCRQCGSPVFSRHVQVPGVLRVRAGLLEGELKTRPVAHSFVASKANWWTLDDKLPRYAERQE